MKTTDKIYTVLCILFSSLIILGNLTYRKYVALHVPFHVFELSVGAILYPLTFLITDLITEFYGKEKATFCVRTAIFMNITAATIVTFMDYLPATKWSIIDSTIFHQVFGSYSVAVIGSITACYIAQAIDIRLYLWIRKLTKGKYLWLRNNGSTIISLFFDTFAVNLFLVMFNIYPSNHMWSLIGSSYSWKLFFTICSTPLFYLLVRTMRLIFARQHSLSQQ